MTNENIIPQSELNAALTTRVTREWSTLTLPSLGHMYCGTLPDGKIQISQLTGREEAIFDSRSMNITDKLEALYATCVKMPPEFKYELAGKVFSGVGGLIISDRLSTLMAIRSLSFGGKYQLPWTCEGCNTKNKSHIDLADFALTTPQDVAAKFKSEDRGDVGEEPYAVPLQKAKTHDGGPITVGVRFLRGQDEAGIKQRIKQLEQDNSADMNPASTVRRAVQIVTVTGIPEWLTLPWAQREAWIQNNIVWSDGAAIDNALRRRATGPINTIELNCRSCGMVNSAPFEMDSDFFRPTDI